MTAPTINGARYPQPVEALVSSAMALDLPDGQRFPSRNRLMREFRIGAPKAEELLARLKAAHADTATVEGSMGHAGPVERGDMSPVSVADSPESDTTTRPGVEIVPAGSNIEGGMVGHPDVPALDNPVTAVKAAARAPRSWPVFLLALPAFVAVWSGWVGLGELTGFGVVHPLPGIWDAAKLNTAITLPIGVEAYAAYAIRVWLSPVVSSAARRFAKWSTCVALLLGAGGQIAYHLMSAWHMSAAPWPVTTAVASLPVIVVFAGSALAHLVHTDHREEPRS